MIISAAVGQGGDNKPDDVRAIQRLLNDYRARNGQPRLSVDGRCGASMIAAITQYQSKRGLKPADGLVEPRSKTLHKLLDDAISGISEGLINLPQIPGVKLPPEKGIAQVDSATIEEIFKQLKA